MPKVRSAVTRRECRCGYHKAGDEFDIGGLCPPLCHVLWHTIYPSVYALLNGGSLDYGPGRAPCFDAQYPDGDRVCIHGSG